MIFFGAASRGALSSTRVLLALVFQGENRKSYAFFGWVAFGNLNVNLESEKGGLGLREKSKVSKHSFSLLRGGSQDKSFRTLSWLDFPEDVTSSLEEGSDSARLFFSKEARGWRGVP